MFVSGSFEFLSIFAGPTWTGGKYQRDYNVSTDGLNYTKEYPEVLFGAYYFLSDERVEH